MHTANHMPLIKRSVVFLTVLSQLSRKPYT
jgi:hypothetical protein